MRDVYPILLERTRQIRRDNYLLTNLPVVAYCQGETSQNTLFSMKVMTSFLKHNSVILPPIEQCSREVLELKSQFEQSVATIIAIKQGREAVDFRPVRYDPVGYSKD
jgi:hypothetical protein